MLLELCQGRGPNDSKDTSTMKSAGWWIIAPNRSRRARKIRKQLADRNFRRTTSESAPGFCRSWFSEREKQGSFSRGFHGWIDSGPKTASGSSLEPSALRLSMLRAPPAVPVQIKTNDLSKSCRKTYIRLKSSGRMAMVLNLAATSFDAMLHSAPKQARRGSA